jgi:endonuclease/exonuclease/phosphatase (EEP) superfamily protein YafD
MFRRVLAALLLVALAAALLVVTWPQLLGLERTFVVAQIVSLRGLAVFISAVLVVTLLLISIVYPGARRFTASVALVLLVFCGVTFALLATRGFGGPGFQTKADRDLTVFSWNTLGDSPGAKRIAELALAQKADIVVLPETSLDTASIVAAIMTQAGSPMNVLHVSLDEISKARTTSLLISNDLGAYQVDEAAGSTATLPSLVATPLDGDGPVIVAAHPVSPIPGEMKNWTDGLAWLATQCARPNVIVAGDFNSTLDHYGDLAGTGELGDCVDGARATGSAAVGTWPTQLPQLMGAPIDHVMATDGWQFVGFRVIGSDDGSGSDHRPIVAQLRPGK